MHDQGIQKTFASVWSFLERAVKTILRKWNGDLAVSLCCGDQEPSSAYAWKKSNDELTKEATLGGKALGIVILSEEGTQPKSLIECW